MVKKTWIIACSLLLVAIAGFADSPGPGPVSDEVLAAILGEPLAGASCATKAGGAAGGADEIRFVAAVAGEKATCTVDCGNGTSVTCTSNTTCTAVQRNCVTTLEAGHVTCDGITTSCTPSCCTGGTVQQNACCRCDIQGDCFSCCKCEGGIGCARQCSGEL
ncbi:MAG TPA: hypothetical protein VJ725_33640 [Thermoanaerobaculia bacterium]|nr:hypothetical protein [Thermoanaerobaculia bacterium]